MHYRLIPAALAAAFINAHPAQADEAAIVVTATRMPARASEVLNDVTVLERADIEAGAAQSLPELLAAQPGVQMTTNGGVGKSGSLYLRGAESRHTVVLVDGLRINSATAGDTAIQHIPLSQIERIEIVRGPVSSLYGSEAIGGVVQIFTKKGEGEPRASIQASYGSRNTSDLSVGLSGARGALDYAFTFGRYETDGVSAIANPANASFNPDADDYRQDSLSGRLGLTLAPGHTLAANLFYSDGVGRYDGTGSYDRRTLATLQAAGIESKNRLAKNWTSTLRLSESMDDYTDHRSATGKDVFRTKQSQAVWQNDIRTGVGEFLAGIERLDQRVAGTTTYTVKERTVDSLLLGYQGRFGAHRLQASLRRDDNSQFGAKTTGMAYYGYQIAPDWRASFGAGTSFSAPTFNHLYYPFGWGNPALKPERGRNREAAIAWERGHDRLSATWFDNRVVDLIQYNLSVTPKYQNVQKAKLSGWTFAGETTLAGWRARASLDLLDALDADTGKRLPRRAEEHLTLAASRSFGVWSVNGEMVASGDRYDDSANTKRLGGYTVFNAGIDYRHSPEATLFARAANMFDKKYELASDYAAIPAGYFVGIRYTPR